MAAPLAGAGGEARGESWMERSGDGGAAVEAARRRERRRGPRPRGGEGREKETAAAAVAAMAGRGGASGRGGVEAGELGVSVRVVDRAGRVFSYILVVVWLFFSGRFDVRHRESARRRRRPRPRHRQAV